MKLEVGMYVRTKDGIIDKVIIDYKGKCNSPNCNCKHVSCQYNYYDEVDIINASHNITDLIEEHDYIRIITSAYFEPVYYSYGKLVIRDDIDISKYTNNFITEIITHEQMESMSYKVGE